MIDNTLRKTIPFISASDLSKNYNTYQILDTRELNEYHISHLKNAIHVGYNNFSLKKTTPLLSKEKPIVVYCSIGYRSEKIGEKLLKKGYTVYNLYGGIFDWKNNTQSIIGPNNKITEKIHCYNKTWSKWLLKGDKIYD